MTLHFEEEGDVSLPFDGRPLAERVAEAALDYIGCPYEAEVNLLLTGNPQIRKMNRRFRAIDRPTDVLSFPMLEFEKPGDFSFLDGSVLSFHPETGELLFGDIVISKEKVKSQALEYGHSPEREFAFLVAHSMLHLAGYDHMEEAERLQMERMQEEILEKLHILRKSFLE